MRKKQNIVLESVRIEAIAAEGKALAHIDNAVIFVPYAVPGDVVDIRVTKKKKNYMEGLILRMVTPSPERLEPFCEHFGLCGGCKWQILPYEMQLAAKQQQVEDQLVRLGHLEIPPISPILASDNTTYYRNKLEFTFSDKRWLMDDERPEEGENIPSCPGVGFHVGRFFDKVLDIRKCWLQSEISNEIRNFIREYAFDKGLSFYNIRSQEGWLRNLIVRNNRQGDVMLILVVKEDEKQWLNPLLDTLLARFPSIKSLYYVINGKVNDSISDLPCQLYAGEDAIYEGMENLRFKIGPKSFYQTNTDQAYKLYSVAREFAALTGSETVYDLYTGTGTIAQFVSGKAAKVVGIEYVPEAIEDAKNNAQANHITNCEFFAGDMKDVLTSDFIARHGQPDVIILDPPRAGIHPDVAKVILKAAPARMVYVSCNPASQARDLALFCHPEDEQAPRYTITAVQPVDMFPHTHHVENVVALEII